MLGPEISKLNLVVRLSTSPRDVINIARSDLLSSGELRGGGGSSALKISVLLDVLGR